MKPFLFLLIHSTPLCVRLRISGLRRGLIKSEYWRSAFVTILSYWQLGSSLGLGCSSWQQNLSNGFCSIVTCFGQPREMKAHVPPLHSMW